MDLQFLLGNFTPTDWFVFGYLFVSGCVVIVGYHFLKNQEEDDDEFR